MMSTRCSRSSKLSRHLPCIYVSFMLLLALHLIGVELILVAYLIAIVDLMEEEGVVDAQDLVLKESCIHFLVFLFTRARLWPLLLLVSLGILLLGVVGWLRLAGVLGENFYLGAVEHGGVLVEASLTDKSISL